MSIDKDTIISTLQELKNNGQQIKSTQYDSGMGIRYIESSAFNPWRAKLLTIIDAYGINAPEVRERIVAIDTRRITARNVDEVVGYIDTLISLLDDKIIVIDRKAQTSPDDTLSLIFNRFHKVARQLRTRHANRETLRITDEYDVQDLLHALLLVHFDDVRPEEWTPSYAGSSVRMDFLLKDCQTVIEVKKTRPSMTAKELGEELIIDIEKYRVHPDCKTLYCFVYDPEGHLGNPTSIKNDLEASHLGFVKVFIRPE